MLAIVLLSPLARVAPGAVLARRLLRLAGWAGLVLFGLLGAAAPAGAEAGAALDASLLDDVRALALGKAGESGGSRVEVSIGQLDPRLRLAPCQSIEPYLPPGVRLWGKAGSACAARPDRRPGTSICRSPSRCSAAPWWCPAAPPPAASSPRPTWPRPRSTWPKSSPPPCSSRSSAVGRTLAQNLKPGQTLRQTHLKSRQWFVAGETVRVVASGAGFALESEAQALSNGIEGQPARVRTENGRVLTGLPSGERRVEVGL